MNYEDIKKMQEVSSRLTREKSLELMNKMKEDIDAKMKELRQQEIEQEKMFLEELFK